MIDLEWNIEDVYGAEISERDREMINMLNQEIGANDEGAQFDPQAAEEAARLEWEARYEDAMNFF